ncbi:vacuolar protein sorting 16 [Ascobolus immersus RN42]|uniref:Probable vacuolar protein sorting-associated protein 16 homolog n=1 Tax=Ascobolus immersus RN42 TaxID=1160509 RepID=A0A3N4IMA3_ASCIM|nr:vacuolar protein sorting 16 [Ascobolus immersus RN42]
MASSSPTDGWELVENHFYRKIQSYTGLWEEDPLDLSEYLVAAAPYGGALALYRTDTEPRAYRGTQQKPSIDLYTCSGKPIRKLPWDKGVVKGLGWSDDEKLLVITADGKVRCYHDLQGDFSQFTLGYGTETHGVRDVRFWSSGFVALTGDNRLIAVSRYDEPRPRLLADPEVPQETPIHSWAIVPPAYTLSRHVEVFLAVEKTIYIVDQTEVQNQMMDQGPFLHISVSPNGNLTALYSESERVWVVSTDFQNKWSEVDVGMGGTHPIDMVWCSNDSVVLAWQDEVQMMGPNGIALRYFYDDRVHVLPDVDGVKLLSGGKLEFLQKVPDILEEIFRIGSTSPASVLLDAIDQLEKESPKADDDIQLIRQQLPEAVNSCIQAAGYEFNVHWQKQLLKAASFGKSVLELYNSDEFVEMTETLRVLNAVRYYEVGMPLTYDQYLRLTPEKLIERLLNRQQHLFALRISEYLHLATAPKIYIHWACLKVRHSSLPEDEICRTIVDKLSSQPGISFEEVARTAFNEGRGHLATQLLNYEPRAGKQVPLLLSMEEDDIALDKAIESGDTDLIQFVLMHLKKKLPLAQFFRVVNPRPVAYSLIESEARQDDRELLKDLYYQDDRRADGAYVVLEEALMADELPKELDKLSLTTKLLSDSKLHLVDAAAISEFSALLTFQENLERILASPYLHLSLNDTALQLLKQNHSTQANKLKSEFKIPDTTYTYLRLRAWIHRRDWPAIEEYSIKNKKSPIGWVPFFEELANAKQPKVAALFVEKCGGAPRERMERWERIGMVVEACKVAIQVGDWAAVEELKVKLKNEGERREVERLVEGKKRR